MNLGHIWKNGHYSVKVKDKHITSIDVFGRGFNDTNHGCQTCRIISLFYPHSVGARQAQRQHDWNRITNACDPLKMARK